MRELDALTVDGRGAVAKDAGEYHQQHNRAAHSCAAWSADLFRQLDDDLLGAADIAESVDVLVAPQLADEL